MEIHTLGIDLGKTHCNAVGFDALGNVVLRRRFRRQGLLRFTANSSFHRIGMEACCGAHHLGRKLIQQGHDVRLMAPHYVRPYVKSQKNDDRDAEAIAEAVGRPTMRFVPLKSEAQLDLQSIHRVRDRMVRSRTAIINQMRALLLERGITIPKGRKLLAQRLADILSDPQSSLSPRLVQLIGDMRSEWRQLDTQIRALEDELLATAKEDPASNRLLEIPGIGPMIATAVVAAIGNGAAFKRGRDLSAWLGLVPREHSTGGRQRLLRISKRGNRYLRRLLVHGARAALPHLLRRTGRLSKWLNDLLVRAHWNVVVVALANKLARIAWAVLRGNRRYATASTA